MISENKRKQRAVDLHPSMDGRTFWERAFGSARQRVVASQVAGWLAPAYVEPRPPGGPGRGVVQGVHLGHRQLQLPPVRRCRSGGLEVFPSDSTGIAFSPRGLPSAGDEPGSSVARLARNTQPTDRCKDGWQRDLGSR